MDRRFIITIVCILSILTVTVTLSTIWNKHYNTKTIHYRGSDSKEPFISQITASPDMIPRPCNVYYTSNIDLCDDPVTPWYRYNRDDINSNITLLENKTRLNTITSDEQDRLSNFKRVMTDYDILPFKQHCKLTMYGMSEASTHPYKINKDDDASKRGDPSHWAFCFEDSMLASNLPRNTALKANPAFTKVFDKSGLTIDFPDGTSKERYDMKTLASDHLLDLHCAMYSGLSIQSGAISPLYNNRDMLELTFNPSTRSITGVRPVYYSQAGIYISNPTRARNTYKRFFEIIRQPTQFIIQQRTYKPTIYRLLFNLCNATATTTAPNPNATSTAGDALAHPKSVEIIVERQRYMISQFFTLPSSQAVDITPYGDISDLVIQTNIT
jgi:hypothetical protein